MGEHVRDQFTLAVTGDVIQNRELGQFEGTAENFDALLSELRGADATVGHFEGLVHDYERGYPSGMSPGTYMRTPQRVLDDLAGLGFDAVSAASNHSYDYLHGGILETIDNFESHDIALAGLGQDLYHARKPAYVETPGGRVGLLSICTTFELGSDASRSTEAVRGRPGINPLGLEKIYRLPSEELEALRGISRRLGLEDIKEAWLERGLVAAHDWYQEEFFHFEDMKFEEVDEESETGITYRTNQKDWGDILDWIAEAGKTADWVVVAVHSHEGPAGTWNTETTPAFLQEFARDCVDAGADAFVGTGPHQLRGCEVYEGRPIFYSLGNFVMQNESVARLPADAFDRWGLNDERQVSSVFDARYGLLNDKDEPTDANDGNADNDGRGDLTHRPFWEAVVPVCTFDRTTDAVAVDFHPIVLQAESPRPQRGVPVLACGERAESILDRFASLSSTFDTEFERDGPTARLMMNQLE